MDQQERVKEVLNKHIFTSSVTYGKDTITVNVCELDIDKIAEEVCEVFKGGWDYQWH